MLDDLHKLADAAESEGDVDALRGHHLMALVMDKAAANVRGQAERIFRHHGQLRIESTLGKGTTVRVWLPTT